MYGPDGKAYAPWMVGKVNEDYTKKGKISGCPHVILATNPFPFLCVICTGQ